MSARRGNHRSPAQEDQDTVARRPERGLPRIVAAVLRRCLPHPDVDVVLGDLAEEAGRYSTLARPVWLARQTASLVAWSLIDRSYTVAPSRASVLSALMFEARGALRGLRRSPAFAGAMIATIALGVGGTTTVFALVHGILLAPLEYPQPERLVAVWPDVWASKGLYRDLADDLTGVRLAAFSGGARVLGSGQDDPELLLAPEVSAGFLDVLGYRPALGRFLRPEDNAPDAEPVVVLTWELFVTRFEGNEGIVGRTIRLDGQSWTVVGVLPPRADLLQPGARMVTPLRIDPDVSEYRDATYLKLVGRLRDGTSSEQASAEVRVLAAGLRDEYGFSGEQVAAAKVEPLRELLVGDRRPVLTLLMAAVLLVLLAASVNAGNLTLARQLSRRTEVAVRSALGSGHGRTLVSLAAESVLLAFAGGATGALIATWALRAIRAAQPLDLPRLAGVGLSPAVLAVTVATTGATALAAGLMPAWRALGVHPADALRRGRSSSSGRRARVAREALAVMEVALAVVLVAGAGVMARSLWSLAHVDPGFRADHRLLLQLAPPPQGVGADFDATRYYERMVEALGSLPATVAAAAVHVPPVRGGGWVMNTEIEGVAYSGAADRPSSYWRVVTPGYFDTLGTPVVRGRPLRQSDTAGSMPVALVNETFAKRHWPDADPLGKRIRIGFDSDAWLTVVGVVADIRLIGIGTGAPPTVYRPLRQAGLALMRVGVTTQALVLHTRTAPHDALPAVRRAIHDVDPSVALVDPMPMDAAVRKSLAQPRLLLQVLAAFGGTALLLSIVGIVGVVSDLVRDRRREFGIRQALGARPQQIVGSSLGRGAALGLIGLIIGSAGALLLAPLIGNFLFGVTARDPLTLVGALLVLTACVLAASWVPARRALRTNPADVLRS